MARAASLFSLFLVCLTVRIGATYFSRCGSPSCLCFHDRAVATCGSLGPRLTRVPQFQRREVSKITGINLSRQNIRRVRATDFTRTTWPSLEWIDFRENPALDCTTLRGIPQGVKILTDCPKPSPQVTTVQPTQYRAGLVGKGGIIQSDSSDSVPVDSDSKASSAASDTDKNKTKTKQVVIPFKGYFKFFLPELK